MSSMRPLAADVQYVRVYSNGTILMTYPEVITVYCRLVCLLLFINYYLSLLHPGRIPIPIRRALLYDNNESMELCW
jgi:hypothetical protein